MAQVIATVVIDVQQSGSAEDYAQALKTLLNQPLHMKTGIVFNWPESINIEIKED